MEIRGRSFDSYTICGKTFTTIGIDSKAELWPGLIKYQFIQTSPTSLEIRGICAADTDPCKVMSGLAETLQHYHVEQGCDGVKITWSTEPFIPNKQGGKIPLYVKLF